MDFGEFVLGCKKCNNLIVRIICWMVLIPLALFFWDLFFIDWEKLEQEECKQREGGVK